MSERVTTRRVADPRERLLAGVARRIGLAAAARIHIGQLTVVLPDGRRRRGRGRSWPG